MDYAIGGLAGAGATFLTNPIDVIKTRMQLEGQLKAKTGTSKFKGVFHAASVIGRTEGVMALQSGLAPAVLFAMLMNGVRLGLYNVLTRQGLHKTDGVESPTKVLAYASFCGAAGAVVAHPAQVIKTRMQAAGDPAIAVGTHKYKGTIDAFCTILKTDGVRGLYAGLAANMMRTFFGSGAQLSVFSLTRKLLLQYDMFKQSPTVAVAFVASMLGGAAICLGLCPFDVVAVRLYNQSQGKDELLYKGVADCFVKTLRAEGVQGLYKGLWPLYLRIGPHSMSSLVIWDSLNRLLVKSE